MAKDDRNGAGHSDDTPGPGFERRQRRRFADDGDEERRGNDIAEAEQAVETTMAASGADIRPCFAAATVCCRASAAGRRKAMMTTMIVAAVALAIHDARQESRRLRAATKADDPAMPNPDAGKGAADNRTRPMHERLQNKAGQADDDERRAGAADESHRGMKGSDGGAAMPARVKSAPTSEPPMKNAQGQRCAAELTATSAPTR